MQNRRKQLPQMTIMLSICMCFMLLFGLTMQVNAASKYRLNKTSFRMIINETEDLRLIGASGLVKWKSSNSKVAYVDAHGRVYGLKAGTVTISAKYGTKTYKCKVTVSRQQDVYGERLVKYINLERVKYGVPPLQRSSALDKAAKKRAKELAVRFRTTRLNGASPFSAISVDYPWKSASQLIARRYLTPKQTVDAWSKNKTQHATLLRSKYNEVGTACYLGSDGKLYWVAFFAKR